MNTYFRNCPKCGRELTTHNKYWNERAIRENRQCIFCLNRSKVITDEWRRNMRRNHADFSEKNNPFYGKHHTDIVKETLKNKNIGKNRFSDEYRTLLREKMRGENNPFYGMRHTKITKQKLSYPKTDEHKRKLKLALKGNPSPLKGKHHTNESKRKMRISAIKRISRIKFDGALMCPNINPKEVAFFSQMESERGWDGIFYGKHGKRTQYLIEHLGYFVDYYEPTKNIVVEYDETNHYNADWSLKEKDIIRQKEIVNYLGCKFFRYNEVLDKWYE